MNTSRLNEGHRLEEKNGFSSQGGVVYFYTFFRSMQEPDSGNGSGTETKPGRTPNAGGNMGLGQTAVR